MKKRQIIFNLAAKIIKEVGHNIIVKELSNKQLSQHLKYLIEREFEKIEN